MEADGGRHRIAEHINSVQGIMSFAKNILSAKLLAQFEASFAKIKNNRIDVRSYVQAPVSTQKEVKDFVVLLDSARSMRALQRLNANVTVPSSIDSTKTINRFTSDTITDTPKTITPAPTIPTDDECCDSIREMMTASACDVLLVAERFPSFHQKVLLLRPMYRYYSLIMSSSSKYLYPCGSDHMKSNCDGF